MLKDIQLYSEFVRRAGCPGLLSRGVGAERICELVGNVTIQERWTTWDEGRSFRYEGFGLPFVKSASNVWSVTSENEQQSTLTTEAEVELKGGAVGRLWEPIMKLMMRRMAPNALSAF